MLQLILKVAVTSVLIEAASEAAKRNVIAGAVIASVPLTSVIAMIWLYADTGDTAKVAAFASGVFWLVLPSILLFLVLPFLLNRGWDFGWSLAVSIALTVAAYLAMLQILKQFGVAG